MAIDYTEFIKGRADYADRINSSRVFSERGGLKPDVFYPMVPMRDEEDEFPVSDVMELEKKMVKVCMRPGDEPEMRELYIEGDWAYEITATDGQPGE